VTLIETDVFESYLAINAREAEMVKLEMDCPLLIFILPFLEIRVTDDI
jgi:hypothetical protein